MRGVFVSATGTGCGKTWIARGLARALVARGVDVAAVKPIETGFAAHGSDAAALAAACGRPELAMASGLPRLDAPLSPLAAARAGEPAVDVARVAAAARAAIGASFAVVEGAGGILAPVSRGTTIADLARALELPLLLATPNALGCLSHTLAAVGSALSRGLRIAAIVMVPARPDPSTADNAGILRDETRLPVVEPEASTGDDADLARIVEQAGLVELVLAAGSGVECDT